MIRYFIALYRADGAWHYNPDERRFYPYYHRLYRRYYMDRDEALAALYRAQHDQPGLALDSTTD